MTTHPEQSEMNIDSRLPAWAEILVCADCLRELKSSDGELTCLECRRKYCVGRDTIELLPQGEPSPPEPSEATGDSWRGQFVQTIYTRHNRSRAVQRALGIVLDTIRPEGWGLNIGSSDTQVHPRVLNLDIRPGPTVQIVASAARLPIADDTLDCVVSQEVFEHLPDPWLAAREANRVLRPGGLIYLQVPFIFGFHSGPADYWRFTQHGLEQLLQASDFEMVEVGPSVGAGTSCYRIGVELFAACGARIWRRLYMPSKAIAAVLFSPLRWTDWIAGGISPTNRISGGFYAIARKRSS